MLDGRVSDIFIHYIKIMGAIMRLIHHLERSLLVSIYMYIFQAIVDLEPFPSTVNPGACLGVRP